MSTMTLRKDSLSVLLNGYYLSPEEYPKIAEVLGPLYEIAETDGPYPLLAESELNAEKIARVIGTTLDLGSSAEIEIVFLSLSEPWPKPAWATDREYQNILGKILKGSLGKSFCDMLRKEFGGSNLWDFLQQHDGSLFRDRPRWAGLGDRDRNKLANEIRKNLVCSLKNRLKAWFEIKLGNRLMVGLESSLFGSIFFYLSESIAGMNESVERLETLVQLLPHCIPLGAKKNDPHTFIVCCR